RRRFPSPGPQRGIPAGTRGTGVDRRAQPADRLPLGRRQRSALSSPRGRIGGARAGTHCGHGRLGRGAAAADHAHRAGRVPAGDRSGQLGLRCQPGAAGRERDRICPIRIRVSAKWLELLKEIAPRVTRAAVLRDPTVPVGLGQLGAIQSVAPSLKFEISPLGVRDARDIEHAITAFGRRSSDGLIVLPSVPTVLHRNLIVTLAAQRKMPAVYPYRFYAAAGGLICYGPDEIEQYRQAAGYVDRILKGEKPSELPVQTPTKFEMVINLKTAKTLDLEIPSTVLARADGVIE